MSTGTERGDTLRGKRMSGHPYVDGVEGGVASELVDIQLGSIVSVGGSFRSRLSELEPLTKPAPWGREARRSRLLVEQHEIQPPGGLLPSLVPPHVRVRVARTL
jgi:hypothetical protein